jgi:Fur family ferric uptake transcriptional regulator
MHRRPTRKRREARVTAPVLDHEHVAGDAENALAVLREHGLRLTGPRRRVVEVIFAASAPVSAETISDALDGSVDPASVYRTLEALERTGLVQHVHFGHGAGLYEPFSGERRVYAVCETCGLVRVVSWAELDEVRRLIDEAVGIDPGFRHFPIVGRCHDCRSDHGHEETERSDHAHP